MRSRITARGLVALAMGALALSGAGGSAGAAPTVTAPIADVEMAAGSTVAGAIDLSAHFDSGGAEGLAFSALGLTASGGRGPDLVVIRIRGPAADILAPESSRTGAASFQIEACAPAGGGCTLSNVFEVRVVAPLFGRPDFNPPGFGISSSTPLAETVAGDAVEVHLEVPPDAALQASPVWYLDNKEAAVGGSLRIEGLSAGAHRIEARFETTDGPIVVTREFHTALAPPAVGAPAPFLWLFTGAAVGIALAAGSRARLRSPLVLFVVGSVYDRLRKESLLDHFRRGALHQAIRETPGIHFSELRRRTQIPHGSAVHHLRALEQGGYIRAVPTGAFTRYFLSEYEVDPDNYGLSPADTSVLEAVVEHPGISLGDLANRLGRSLGTTSGAVSRLTSLGYVTTRRSLRRKIIYPRPGRAVPLASGRQEPDAKDV